MSDSVQPHRRQPTRLPHPWDFPGKNIGVGCHFLLQCMKVKMKVKSLSRVRLFATPWTTAYQAPPSMGVSRQEYWSGVPLPSPWELYYYSKLSIFIFYENEGLCTICFDKVSRNMDYSGKSRIYSFIMYIQIQQIKDQGIKIESRNK